MELRITKTVPATDLRPGMSFMDGGNLYTADEVRFALDGGVVVAARRGHATEGRRHTIEFKPSADVTLMPSHDESVALRRRVIEALAPWVEATDWDVQLGTSVVGPSANFFGLVGPPAHLAARMKDQA